MATKKYIIEITKTKEGTQLNRTNDGFNIFELLGLLEIAKGDLLEQFKKDAEDAIDVVKRQVVEEGIKDEEE